LVEDLKKFEKAIQDYNQAIELNPKHACAFHNRGTAYADLKQDLGHFHIGIYLMN
jgi:tetratricopeptide (TPR) repeat protein